MNKNSTWLVWEINDYPYQVFPVVKMEREMNKYGDQDEKYLEEKIADLKEREKNGEKAAEEAVPLEQLLEKTKKERRQDG